jgi:sugar phosphate permease
MRARPGFVLLTLVVAYGAFYLCRANVDSAIPLLIGEYHYSKADVGFALSSVPIGVRAIGKFGSGALGDVIGGKRMLLLALAGSVVASIAFGASSGLTAFMVLAACNQLFQSGGWPGAIWVIARWFDPRRHGIVMGVMSLSYELGNVLSILFCALVTSLLAGWRPLFFINPLLLLVVGLCVVVALRAEPPRKATHVDAAAPDALAGPASAPREPLIFILRALASKPAFWIAVVLSVLLTFLRIGFLTWTPTYLAEMSREAGHAAVSGAIAKSAIFPAAGVVAALTVGAVSDRFGPGRRAPVMAASLAVVVVLALTLGHVHARSAVAPVLLIGATGLALLGPYSLLAGALALDVSGKRGASTAAGIIDGAGYVGASAAGWLLGKLADKWGWSAVFDVIALAALAATIVSGAWGVSVLRRARVPATVPALP